MKAWNNANKAEKPYSLNQINFYLLINCYSRYQSISYYESSEKICTSIIKKKLKNLKNKQAFWIVTLNSRTDDANHIVWISH